MTQKERIAAQINRALETRGSRVDGETITVNGTVINDVVVSDIDADMRTIDPGFWEQIEFIVYLSGTQAPAGISNRGKVIRSGQNYRIHRAEPVGPLATGEKLTGVMGVNLHCRKAEDYE